MGAGKIKIRLILILSLCTFVFALWWITAPRNIDIPTEIYVSIPECVYYEKFKESVIGFPLEEIDKEDELHDACRRKIVEYMNNNRESFIDHVLRPPNFSP